MKKILLKFKKILLNWLDVIEALILLIFIKNIWGIFLGIVLMFIAIRRHWRVFKSKQIIKEKLINERVAANEGPQGAGKTSLMLYMASLEYKANEIYTMVPCKVNGEFTNVLTKEILSLKVRMPKHTCMLLDEMSAYFPNTMNMKEQSNLNLIEPIAVAFQFIRHFTNGNSLGTSVSMERVNKHLEEKHSVFNSLLKQKVCNNSYIIFPTFKLFLFLIGKYDSKKHKYLGKYRVWYVQTFKPITHDNYVYDLSNQKENKTKNDGFSNLIEIWAYNNLDYEYNDTYLSKLYETLPLAEQIKWESLEINREMLHKIGQSNLLKYFPTFK